MSRWKTYMKNPELGLKESAVRKKWMADTIWNNFEWDYWVTFTFGYNPDLEEVEDILYKLHYRLDRRILKHRKDVSTLHPKDRSEWILFPHIDGGRGLHYHGFVKLNTRPHIGSYDTEWVWMKSALDDTCKKLDSLLSNNGKIGTRFYERGRSDLDDLRTVLYSLNNFTKSKPNTPYPNFDPFLYSILSHVDWKPSYLNKHSRNKIHDIPPRPNKFGLFDSV